MFGLGVTELILLLIIAVIAGLWLVKKRRR